MFLIHTHRPNADLSQFLFDSIIFFVEILHFVTKSTRDMTNGTCTFFFPILLDVCQLFLHDEDILLLALGGIQNLVLSSKESYVNRCRLADSGGLVILSQIYDISASETIKARCLQAIKNLFGSSM